MKFRGVIGNAFVVVFQKHSIFANRVHICLMGFRQ